MKLGNTTAREKARIIAHELGHGVFSLEHPWAKFPKLLESTTDNLMDYGSGTHLYSWQWHQIHNPPPAIPNIFQDSKEGMKYSKDEVLAFLKKIKEVNKTNRGFMNLVSKKAKDSLLPETVVRIKDIADAMKASTISIEPIIPEGLKIAEMFVDVPTEEHNKDSVYLERAQKEENYVNDIEPVMLAKNFEYSTGKGKTYMLDIYGYKKTKTALTYAAVKERISDTIHRLVFFNFDKLPKGKFEEKPHELSRRAFHIQLYGSEDNVESFAEHLRIKTFVNQNIHLMTQKLDTIRINIDRMMYNDFVTIGKLSVKAGEQIIQSGYTVELGKGDFKQQTTTVDKSKKIIVNLRQFFAPVNRGSLSTKTNRYPKSGVETTNKAIIFSEKSRSVIFNTDISELQSIKTLRLRNANFYLARRINAGVYKGVMHRDSKKPHFQQKTIRLQKNATLMGERDGILIHQGFNSSFTEGCIAVTNDKTGLKEKMDKLSPFIYDFSGGIGISTEEAKPNNEKVYSIGNVVQQSLTDLKRQQDYKTGEDIPIVITIRNDRETKTPKMIDLEKDRYLRMVRELFIKKLKLHELYYSKVKKRIAEILWQYAQATKTEYKNNLAEIEKNKVKILATWKRNLIVEITGFEALSHKENWAVSIQEAARKIYTDNDLRTDYMPHYTYFYEAITHYMFQEQVGYEVKIKVKNKVIPKKGKNEIPVKIQMLRIESYINDIIARYEFSKNEFNLLIKNH